MHECLKSIKTFLIDLDGTLYLGGKLFPETLPCLETMRNLGKKYLFLTNNSSRSTNQYLKKLQQLGIPAEKNDILTSGWATIHYILNETNYRKVFLLGTQGLKTEFEEEGLTVVNAKNMDGEPETEPDVLVVGFDQEFTYNRLCIASRLLFESIPYIATHPDIVCPTESWPIPDTGSLIVYFETITGRRPTVIGKPCTPMIKAALARTKSSPEETAMIGDRLYTDMQMAHDADITSILVLSGETKEEDLSKSKIEPTLVLQHIGELTDDLNN